MKRTGNVLPFSSDKPSDARLKLFATVFYFFLAFFLTFVTGLSLDGISALVLFFILYNFLIRQQVNKAHYFRDNRIFLAILLVVFLIIFKLTMVLLLLMAAIYWLLVGKSGREAPYFLRFHLLTALIFNFFLLMPYLMLNMLIALFSNMLSVAKLGALFVPVSTIVNQALPLFFMGAIWCATIWLAFSAVMGRTPYIPSVTDNVRHWAS